jgi:hypothetical protein
VPRIARLVGGVTLLLALMLASPALAFLELDHGAIGGGEYELALSHAHGLHLRAADGEWGFSCSAVVPEQDALMWTGPDRLLVCGETGAWLTESQGCRWNRTTGVVANKPVAGMYQPALGSASVDMVYATMPEGFGVAHSSDGGVTSEAVVGAHVSGALPLGIVGEGDTRLAVGWSDGVGIRLLRSGDGGLSYGEEPPITYEGAGHLTPAVLWQGDLYLWGDSVLYRVGGEGLEMLKGFDRVNPSVVAGVGGAIWVAAYEEGIWRWNALDGWAQVTDGFTSGLLVRGEVVARLSRVMTLEDVWAECTEDEGGSWYPCGGPGAPDAFPSDCESRRPQLCVGALDGLLGDLGVQVDGPAAPPSETVQRAPGCSGAPSGGVPFGPVFVLAVGCFALRVWRSCRQRVRQLEPVA